MARRSATCRRASGGGHRLPVLRPVPAHERGRERGLRAGGARPAEGGGHPPRRGRAGRRAHGGLRRAPPRALSGGQQQRVALARALAIEPAILLLDEPFAALDRALRLDLQLEIKRIQRRFGVTAVLVTHDQDEAMSMADRMAVMRGGRVEQVDAPATVYDSPATPFVAGFVGTSNRLHGRVEAREGADYRVRLDVGASVILASPRGFAVGERVLLCARPEHRRCTTPRRRRRRAGPPGCASPCRSARPWCTTSRPAPRSSSCTRRGTASPRAGAGARRPAAHRPTRPLPRRRRRMTALSRRTLMGAALGTLGAAGLPFRAAQAAGSMTAAVYPGGWDEALRAVLAPALKQAHGVDVAFEPLFAVDQIAKARAARGVAPFDVFVLDPGPRVSGMDLKLFEPFDPARLSNRARLPAGYSDEVGAGVAAQVVGIAYNPKKVAGPPAGATCSSRNSRSIWA
ncbi:ATP-binding cassette domain-containing protein [Teichococcus aestuarii]|uniref:ATP-binding cassette domain-containing protein n=1 Tax=Teichococcus aestuarii TaxID=568898 RepID=UPI0036070C8D